MKPYLRVVALILGIAAVAIVADPTHRTTTLRVALVALATTAAVGLLQRAARRTPAGAPSPFDAQPERPAAPVVPADLVRLASDLQRYQRPERSRLATGALDRTVRDIVGHRLDHHRGVIVDDPLADPSALALLGPATRSVLARRGTGNTDAVDPEQLVAELEQL